MIYWMLHIGQCFPVVDSMMRQTIVSNDKPHAKLSNKCQEPFASIVLHAGM